MTFGEGMAFNRSIEWQTYSRRFNSDIDTPYYILTSTNEVLTLVPSIGYHFQFPAMVPFWESTYVIHPDGTIENLSPERIQQDPRFQGQRLFPEGLAREIGNSWGYRDGIWNALFIHRNQVEPVSFEHDENQMPYLLPATDSPIWAIACSPVSQAHGINTLLLWNAHSGKMQVYTVPKTASLLGPNKAMEYVRAAYPLYNWTKDETGSVVTLEPRPVIRDSKLYWMVSVTNTNYAGVSLQTLVNAEDGSVRAFHSPDEIQAFLHGTYEGEKPPTSADTQSQQQTDISKMSDDQLFKLIDNALNELKKRREKK
ncbi:hypothetical protein EI42_01175 [Thermosporothrix hazakensis]|jgi:hypothetical protein|uniref:Uncharacterized protein n=2 Tax=Thermosporothrix TaxID=768650 RepID=A0A326UC10_THEHA|nr:hypothetical protein [Thermosporothrix hazakensis]PZW34338.1 hypothetical protein EI42_01175 [Thermosporothrix hazakensis]GCE46113.1 hypothetical protein KTH_09820 [Thermosporothrix hazakensis]